MTDTEILKEIKDRVEKATKGDWIMDTTPTVGIRICCGESPIADILQRSRKPPVSAEQCESDADFIAHSKKDIIKLIEMVERRDKALKAAINHIIIIGESRRAFGIYEFEDNVLKEIESMLIGR